MCFHPQNYAWPLLETLFSEVLTRDEWLKLFDNVFSNHPAYLMMAVVAYCINNRGPLLKCTEFDDFKVLEQCMNARELWDKLDIRANCNFKLSIAIIVYD